MTPRIRQGANLPHWTSDNAIYAVTIRLADSMPQAQLKVWKLERERLKRISELDELNNIEFKRLIYLHSEKLQNYLDVGYGNCYLKNDDVAQIVVNTLHHLDGERYILHAYCIMPNHVHLVIEPFIGNDLLTVMRSIKHYSATEANKLLKRKGVFWLAESYDHLIRNIADYEHALEYLWSNPEKAGLKRWKWRWRKDRQ